jgi:hypothetical protein
MRRLPLLLVGLAFAIALPAQAAAPLSRVQVVAVEFHYRLSRVRIPAGAVRIELANFGQDEHDLTLQRVGSTTIYQLPKALPGQRQIVNLRLKPGVYVLSCSLANHAALGMHSQLRVVAPKPPRR